MGLFMTFFRAFRAQNGLERHNTIPTLTYTHSKLKHEYDDFDEIYEKILFELYFEPIIAVFDLFLA